MNSYPTEVSKINAQEADLDCEDHEKNFLSCPHLLSYLRIFNEDTLPQAEWSKGDWTRVCEQAEKLWTSENQNTNP